MRLFVTFLTLLLLGLAGCGGDADAPSAGPEPAEESISTPQSVPQVDIDLCALLGQADEFKVGYAVADGKHRAATEAPVEGRIDEEARASARERFADQAPRNHFGAGGHLR